MSDLLGGSSSGSFGSSSLGKGAFLSGSGFRSDHIHLHSFPQFHGNMPEGATIRSTKTGKIVGNVEVGPTSLGYTLNSSAFSNEYWEKPDYLKIGPINKSEILRKLCRPLGSED